jgi:DNA-binding XRE family transcriptional regulator
MLLVLRLALDALNAFQYRPSFDIYPTTQKAEFYKMLTSYDWVSYLKTKSCISSDYGAAKLINIDRTTLSTIKSGKSHLGLKSAFNIAKELGIAPEYVYLCAQFERAACEEERKMWLDVFERIGGVELVEKIRKKLDTSVLR